MISRFLDRIAGCIEQAGQLDHPSEMIAGPRTLRTNPVGV
jgi:hypothetical protein